MRACVLLVVVREIVLGAEIWPSQSQAFSEVCCFFAKSFPIIVFFRSTKDENILYKKNLLKDDNCGRK